MPRQIIHTSEAPTSPLFSQGVIAGGHIHLSGMVGIDPATGQLAAPDIAAQTRRTLENCVAILAAGGASIGDIVEVGILLADPADFGGFNEEWTRWFAQDPPARYVAKLGVQLPNVLVSIRMTASRDGCRQPRVGSCVIPALPSRPDDRLAATHMLAIALAALVDRHGVHFFTACVAGV